jgi:hypothetical protein
MYGYVRYLLQISICFQVKAAKVGFGSADLGLEYPFYTLAWGVMTRPGKTSQLAAAVVRLCRAECALARRWAAEVMDARGRAKMGQHLGGRVTAQG